MYKVQNALLWISLMFGLAFAVDICELQMNGVRLAHPADCNKFVICDEGKTDRIISCPLGLHFNRFKGECDIRQRAACDIEYASFASEETDCSACCALYGCVINPNCPTTPTPPEPECPDTSTTTETPDSPATPATPSIPETPSTPGTTPTPATLSTPETPSTPETTTTSETPCAPVTSSIPETTTTPETSPTPATPTTPTTPNTPGTPSIPETTTPEMSSTPETPYTPGIPPSPATPSTPETPSTPTTTPETPITPPTPTTPFSTPATPSTAGPNGNCSNKTICADKIDGSISYVNGTCHEYIVCVGGCANFMLCPENLQYNFANHKCDNPENVDCPWEPVPPLTGPSGVTCAQRGICVNQTDGKMFANPKSNGYIECLCECEMERPCPAGTKFNEQLLTCTHIYNGNDNGNASENVTVICGNDIEICKNETEGTFHPANGICNKFYQCNHGCAIEILCPDNLIYNPNIKNCDYRHNYKCPWPSTPPSGPSAGPSGIACASGGRCIGKAEGTFFPSLNSCLKYVVCQCECEVEMNCSNGLHWDTELSTCSYPEYVNCNLSYNK